MLGISRIGARTHRWWWRQWSGPGWSEVSECEFPAKWFDGMKWKRIYIYKVRSDLLLTPRGLFCSVCACVCRHRGRRAPSNHLFFCVKFYCAEWECLLQLPLFTVSLALACHLSPSPTRTCVLYSLCYLGIHSILYSPATTRNVRNHCQPLAENEETKMWKMELSGITTSRHRRMFSRETQEELVASGDFLFVCCWRWCQCTSSSTLVRVKLCGNFSYFTFPF